jgi:hypothetical protein
VPVGGTLASLLIVAGGFFGVAWIATLRHAELARIGVPYWTPLRGALIVAGAAGLIGLVALHWWMGELPPAVE